MFHSFQRTPKLHVSRFFTVSIYLCALTFLPVPQVATLARTESAEAESPCKEDGKRSEKELSDWCSAHGRSNDQRHRGPSRPPEKNNRRQRITRIVGRVPAIIGHQLANGLCAPMLI